MALTTVAGVSAAILQLRSDVKSSTAIFRRDVRQIRNWIEEESLSSSSKAGAKVKPKQVEGQVHEKETPKDNKH